jgi:hypothetical protein
MLRTYFGEDPGPPCGLCDSCAGLDSEMFDPGDADARHGLHAATDFHARARRRRRKGVADKAPVQVERERQRPTFATAIPEVMPATVPPPWVAPPESDSIIDPTVWDGSTGPGTPAAGEIVFEPAPGDLGEMAEATPIGIVETLPASSVTLETSESDSFAPGWASVRDANIRPFVEWIAVPPVSLPVIPVNRGGGQTQQRQQPRQQQRQNQGGNNYRQQPQQQGQQNDEGGRKRRRHRRRGHHRDQQDTNRGPRLPGVYNPGGD